MIKIKSNTLSLTPQESFPTTNDEYYLLENKFGKLAKKAAWELLRKNTKNNHTDDFDDINQTLLISLMKACSYYKRQCYLEKCFKEAFCYAKDSFIISVLHELADLWLNRTRHGANRQKFGTFQEQLLEKIVNKVVPVEKRPLRNEKLQMDEKFITYCKSIMWNEQKNMGRQITKEKSIRTGMTSLSEHSFFI